MSLPDRIIVNGCQIELVLGNIVDQEVDAIVNAANTKLAGGGGVDGAIHRAAGPELHEACLKLPADANGRRCATGDVCVTTAGRLHAKWVIHAVGPYYNARYAEKATKQLRDVHRLALTAAAERDCRSIAFPAISTGAYRFPIEAAASVAIDEVHRFCQSSSSLQLVRFVLYKEPQLRVFQSALAAGGQSE